MHRLEIAGFGTSVPAPEKWPTFALHRRIRDNLVFIIELPSLRMFQYATVVKSAAGAIYGHIWEWMEWLAGVEMRDSTNAEAQLRGMVKEVVWRNLIQDRRPGIAQVRWTRV
jgi:hypothetical protein